MSKAKDKPQKGARKITIEGETWWFLVAFSKVLVWNPSGKKFICNREQICTDLVITPWDIRLFIDRNIRDLPKEQVDAMVAKRKDRILKEQKEYIDNLRKSVYERAKAIVCHSNNLFQEFHGGDEVDIRNREENRRFLNDLMQVICYDPVRETGIKEKPLPKNKSWYE